MSTQSAYVRISKARSGNVYQAVTIHNSTCGRISALAVRIPATGRDLSPLQAFSFCKVCMKAECAAAAAELVR